MTESQLMYAAMLALTKQNMAFKIAPLSTQRFSGMVIDRNIAPGDTVVIYYNDSGELTRVGDIPTHAGDFFIDDNNKMYYVQDNKLHIVDGLSGSVYSESIDAYNFRVYAAGNCAAFQSQVHESSEDNYVWRVIFPDGVISGEITIPDNSTPYQTNFAYRNGVLALVLQRGVDSYAYGLKIYTLTQDGNFVAQLMDANYSRAVVHVLTPINFNAVGIAFSHGAGFYDNTWYRYLISTNVGLSDFHPWEGYDTSTPSTVGTNTHESFIGADQNYIYTRATLYEEIEEGEQTVKVISGYAYARFSIENYDGIEILDESETDWNSYAPPTPYGSMIRRREIGEEYVVDMIDASTLEQLYANEHLTLTAASNTIRENDGWIWIVGSGVYQKTQIGWLMYPASTYPKSAPWGKLGYSIGKYKIGEIGTAIVLFE